MRTQHLTFCICVTGLAVIYIGMALALPVGTWVSPGPGLFPALVGLLLLGLSISLLVESWRMDTRVVAERILPAGAPGRRVLGLVLSLIVYASLLTTLGYLVAGGLVTVVALRVLGMCSWRDTTLTAVVVAGASYGLFSVVLGVPLPVGAWIQ